MFAASVIACTAFFPQLLCIACVFVVHVNDTQAYNVLDFTAAQQEEEEEA